MGDNYSLRLIIVRKYIFVRVYFRLQNALPPHHPFARLLTIRQASVSASPRRGSLYPLACGLGSMMVVYDSGMRDVTHHVRIAVLPFTDLVVLLRRCGTVIVRD